MHAENLLVDDRSNGQTVEAVCKGLPKLDVITPLAFVVEAINTIDRSAFVVASKNEEILWVLYFISEEEANCLKRLLAAVDIVSQEEIICVWWEASVLKEAQQVIVLAVDVSANLNGGL